MALLQISEPDEKPEPRKARRAVGIDLGTTNSLVATVRNRLPVILADGEGRPLLPSIVRYGEEGVEVGHPAMSRQSSDPQNTIVSVKRFMGRSLTDFDDDRRFPYRFVEGEGMLSIATRAGVKSPVEVSAEILRVLRERAEAELGGPIEGSVVTVPAYFDDAQRQATKDAARLAGLPVMRLLNEPTAAAIAYGLDQGAEGTYAVFDFGGGTFDLSILKLERGVFQVLATAGDTMLGGDDFDHRIFCWILETEKLPPLSAADARLLLVKSREAKEMLTGHDAAPLVARLSTGHAINLELTAEVFNEITQTLIDKTLRPVRRALRDAGLSPQEVKGVVMVGGSTRMPRVRRAVAELFGQPPLVNLNPDEVVALGAAIQAHALVGNRDGDDWLLLDVIPLSLGLETMGGLVEKIIPRNAAIPVSRAQEFTTYKDGQTAMAIHVVQGERERVADCRSLARFELRGIPPMAAGAARIRVTFQVDADGLLSVSAREMIRGVEASVEVKPSYGLTEGEIARMLQASIDHASEDAAARSFAEAVVEADQLEAMTVDALQASSEAGETMETSERARIDAALAELRGRREAGDATGLRATIEALNRATQPLANRRMDRAIRGALEGRQVDEIG